MGIKVISLREMKKGDFIGFAKIEINGVIINDCRVQEGQYGIWCGLPSRMYEKDGVKKYAPIVEISKDMGNELSKVIRAYLNGDQNEPRQQETPRQEHIREEFDGGEDVPF